MSGRSGPSLGWTFALHRAMHDAERAADYLERLLAFDPLALSSARHADVQRAAAALEAARLALLTASTVDPSTKTGA